MTPNLLVATQTLFSPHKWFKSSPRAERPKRKTEHWDGPVPGLYEYIPGRGWYLTATYKDHPDDAKKERIAPEQNVIQRETKRETIKMMPPVPVKYSKVVKKYLLAPDYEARKKHGRIQDDHGKWRDAGFFRLDDGVAWVHCWDEEHQFIPGPYKLWCIDQTTGQFRHMLRGDDPGYIHSRQNSFERETSKRRRSQDSRSTQYRGSGVNTPRDGPSVPSTRASSIRALNPSAPPSKPNSRAPSRRNSPKRSPTLPLEEAKAALRKMAEEQKNAPRSRAGSSASERDRTNATVA